MSLVKLTPAKPLILDFDIENRPLSYWYGDACTAEITAIAWSWVGSDRIDVEVLYPPPFHAKSAFDMIEAFLEAYNQADMVTGHYIRGHDLPLINGALLESGYLPLEPKLVSDTKVDLLKKAAIGVSQEALADMLGCTAPKIQMTQKDWREANRLTPAGIEKTVHRVKGDVIQHKEMRAELLAREWLAPPRMWSP